MEPVTHILTGACLARSGLNRKAAYTTPAMAVAAEFPDIDTLWGLRGPVESFVHHRGITHTFLGIPFEAALLTVLVYALHRWRQSRAQHLGLTAPLTKAPVRWGLLYGFVLLALLSHIALDFTNNYGVRPFFPFHPHWYAASIVFIFDPLLFAILLLALGLPSLFRMVNAEIGAREEAFRGRGLARTALCLVVALYTVRTYEHAQAVTLAQQNSLEMPAPVGVTETFDAPPIILQPQHVLASPDPLSIFRWYTVTDFGPVYQLATADTRRGTLSPDGMAEPKPRSDDPAIRAAEQRSPLGRAYIDWSPMPFVDASYPDPGTAGPGQSTVVTFRDPRFMGDAPLLHSNDRIPLTAVVELDGAVHVLSESMNGKVER